MYGPNEEILKNMAAGQCGSAKTANGCFDDDAGVCAAPPLMERIRRQRSHAQQEARQADRLAELQFLLEKNQEIARILDLLECVKG